MRAVACTVLALGLVTAVATVAGDPRPWLDASLVAPTCFLSVLLLWSHIRPERVIPARGGVESIQLDTVILVPLLLFASPAGLLLATAIAAVAGGLATRRTPVQIVFNTGQLLFATSCGIALIGRLDHHWGPSVPLAPEGLLLAMGAALVIEAVSAVVVGRMVAFATGAPAGGLRDLAAQLRPWAGAILLGGVGTAAGTTSPVAAVLVTGLVAFVHRAYAMSLTEYAARRRAEEVQRVVAALRGHSDSATVRRDLLAAASDLMGAERAVLCAADERVPADALVVPLGEDRLAVSGRQGAGSWSEEDRATLGTLAGVASDVLRAMELIEHDELTGLPNRRLLLDRLDMALTRARDHAGSHGLLFFDLDRFKRVNDSYGHAAGDELLIQVAARVRGNVAATDTVARLSGDEFVVLVEDVPAPEALIGVAERLLEVLATPFDVAGHEVAVSASIGIVLSHPGDDRDRMLATADAAAYQAKREGKNCYHFAEREESGAARARMALEADLRRAVEREELEVHYQPVVDGRTGDVRGVEALVRWRRPGHGLVPPAGFIELAEETGTIAQIGRWVLAEACRTVQAWTTGYDGRQPLTLSVNLSACQFASPHLAAEVAEILSATGLAPQQLCLEITETALMADTTETLATLCTLRALGVRVAIDDFGTGYSSLAYLKQFPVDTVKIDRSFVREIGESRADAEIVGAVVRLATALGMNVVAEGVETPEQRTHLADLGCHLLQGYLLARPCRADRFAEAWSAAAAA